MAAQAALGLLLPEEYRDPAWIRATWFGNDWITGALAVPLLLAGLVLASRGSVRGLLLWLGLIAYAIYNYAFYLFGAALNAFFPVYVGLLVLAVMTLILAVARTDATVVAAAFRPGTPVRAVGGYLVVVGVGLAGVWTTMWAAFVFAGQRLPVDAAVFQVVAALDLWLMVPALTAGGLLLWQRRPWGYVVAPVAAIQGALYLLVLAVNSIVMIRRGFAEAPGELPMWGALAAGTAAAALLLLANVRSEPATPSTPDGEIRGSRRGERR